MKKATITLALLVLIAALTTATIQAQNTGLAKPNLSANYSNDAVHLQWDTIDGATKYELWVWVTEWKHIINTDATSFTHTDLIRGQTHLYTVRALNNTGESGDWASYAEVAVPAIQTVEPTPTATPHSGPKVLYLTAHPTVGGIRLVWNRDFLPGTVRYNLWAWVKSAGWQQIGGDNLTSTTFIHVGLMAGETYYYTVTAVYADGTQSDWSEYASATPSAPQPVNTSQDALRQPPAFLESNRDFQVRCAIYVCSKYLKAPGVHVVATDDTPDARVRQAVEIIGEMLSDSPDLEAKMDGYETIVFLVPQERSWGGFGIAVISPPTETTVYCYLLIHEFAHVIHFTIEGKIVAINEPPTETEFDRRLRFTYQSAIDAGLWSGRYASTNINEYWAETVTFWLRGQIPSAFLGDDSEATIYPPIEEYDPTIVALIVDTLGNASVPEYCQQ